MRNIKRNMRNVIAIAICLAATTAFLSCKKESGKKITAFSITTPAAVGVINEEGKTITITVPASTNVTALVPTITISKKAKISPASGTAQNFTTPVTYTVTAEDKSSVNYRVTVTVLGGGEPGTPVITITTQPAATTNVTAGIISGGISVAASVTAGATLSYQWYSNTSPSNTSGTAIDGATTANYDFSTLLAVGSYYYFCEVSATGGAAKVRSNVATVTVMILQNGTEAHPFLVSSAALLKKVGSGTDSWTMSKHYKQTANISLSGTWTPIGSASNHFTGVYDGGGFSITGLSIPSSSTDYQGLFGVFGLNGVARNVALKGVNINSTGDRIGGIVGYSQGLIENCYVTGTIKGNKWVGGVVGGNSGTTTKPGVIKNCYTTCTVTGSDGGCTGGITGYNQSGTIANCYATGNISGARLVGGIAGGNNGSNCTLSLCVALNKEVTATNAAGLVGRVTGIIDNSSTLTNNFARAAGMTLKEGGSTITPTAGQKGGSTIHGTDVTATNTHQGSSGTWWSSTAGYNATYWNCANNSLPWLKTTTGAAFNEAQNPTVN